VFGRQSKAGQIPAVCGWGFHWKADLDLSGECNCVADSRQNCMQYQLNLGICKKCDDHYTLIGRKANEGSMCWYTNPQTPHIVNKRKQMDRELFWDDY
jgi:hypothetical protein